MVVTSHLDVTLRSKPMVPLSVENRSQFNCKQSKKQWIVSNTRDERFLAFLSFSQPDRDG